MNIWLITSIVMNPSIAPRASSIQNSRTAMALAEAGHNVLIWHAGSRQCNPAGWFKQNFGVEPAARVRFVSYAPRGARLDKKTPFFGGLAQVLNLARAKLSGVAAPDLIITRSPLVLEQLRESRLARGVLRSARLVLEWQYPESIQLWRGWRRANQSATMRARIDTLRELRKQELARLRHADAILYAAHDHERLLRQAKYQGVALLLASACLAPDDWERRSTEEFDFGYSGGLAPENGIDLAIEALARLERGKLLIVGSGREAYVDKLRRRVGELGLGERVHFAGRVKPSEVRDWLRRCRIGLVPISRRCGREKRQFASPLKLIEWMAAGVPTIASNVPSVSGIIQNEALMIPADDAAALAAAMERLGRDGTLRDRLAESGVALAQTLTFRRRAERIIEAAR